MSNSSSSLAFASKAAGVILRGTEKHSGLEALLIDVKATLEIQNQHHVPDNLGSSR